MNSAIPSTSFAVSNISVVWTFLLLIACSSLLADEANLATDGKSSVVLFDGFNDRLSLNWKPIRHDPAAVSLASHPGKLTIRTQAGTIHRQHGPTARNIFVIENPVAPDANFVITTRIALFKPDTAWQQCGLICYDDDDNYLKWILLSSGESSDPMFSSLREIRAESMTKHFPAPDTSAGIYLRLKRSGQIYSCQSSTDGKTFTEHGQFEWSSKQSPKMIGLIAKNGGPKETPEIEAVIDFFEFRDAP